MWTKMENKKVSAQTIGKEEKELCWMLMEGLDSCLTLTQRRRLWMYCVDKLTIRQIAKEENVKHQSVVECLAAAKEKLRNFLKKVE